jgi:GntR family transcriptional regulator/MocR family aminotransferase
MRPVYRRRRDVLLRVLRESLPDLVPAGIAAGLHLVAWLPADLDEASVVRAAAARGVRIAGVAPNRISAPGDGGLIFGYSNLSERAIAEGVEIIAAAINEVRAQ